jgi:hypothetical protein
MLSVLRAEVTFSTIWKVFPGTLSEILKNVEPKSNPITALAFAYVRIQLSVNTPASRDNIFPLVILMNKIN